MQCPRCFFENPSDARWCGYCGNTLAQPAPSGEGGPKPAVGSSQKRATRLGAVPFDDPFKAVAIGLRGGAAQAQAPAKPTKNKGQQAKQAAKKSDRRSTVVEATPNTGFGEVVGALVVFSPASGATAHLLRTGRFRIGRDPDNDLIVEDPRVSAFHAIIRAEPGRAFLLDTSTNGTEVAGQLLQADRAQIADGSVVEVGDVLIVVQILDSDTLDVVRSSGS